MSLALVACLIALFLLCEAFFSGSEIAFVSSNRPALQRLAKEGNPSAMLAKSLLSRPELLFSTTVVGTSLSVNLCTTLSTLYLLERFGHQGEWLTVLLLTPLILLFGEFIPKTLARARPDEMSMKMARPLTAASVLLYPFTRLVTLYARLLRKVLGEAPGSKSFFLSREEIKAAIPASRGSDVTPHERLLIGRILDFANTTAGDMLRPLIDVVAVEESAPLEVAVKIFADSGHSRLPVYRERVDSVVGVLHAFDCLNAEDLTTPIGQWMRPALFIPESMPVDELFAEMGNRSMAVAVNEYGGAQGIITMEDIIEEIVGEIEDEYDEPPSLYYRIGENSYVVNARMEIEDIRETLKVPIPEDPEYKTLAGFLLKRMQKIPKKWDSAMIDGVEYVVQSATDRAVEEVYIIVHPQDR